MKIGCFELKFGNPLATPLASGIESEYSDDDEPETSASIIAGLLQRINDLEKATKSIEMQARELEKALDTLH